mgnify:CR=1 FL=1
MRCATLVHKHGVQQRLIEAGLILFRYDQHPIFVCMERLRLLEEETDPNVVYDLKNTLDEYRVYQQMEIDRFAEIFYASKEQSGGDLGKTVILQKHLIVHIDLIPPTFGQHRIEKFCIHTEGNLNQWSLLCKRNTPFLFPWRE